MKLSGLRVLLAEDNPTNQLVATQMLESLGATVRLAEDGVEALEFVEREPFDVVLVDIEMPRVNGIEVLRTVRALPGPIANLPMIALTAYVMREHRAAIDAAGADGVIAKPILSIEQFGSDIRRYMQGRSAPCAAAGTSGKLSRGTLGPDNSRPVIDRAIFDTLAEAIGPDAMAELMRKVGPDIEGARMRLIGARNPVNLAEVRSVSHILISVAGAIGAAPAQDQARLVNSIAQEGDAVAAATELTKLISEIDRVLEFARARVEG